MGKMNHSRVPVNLNQAIEAVISGASEKLERPLSPMARHIHRRSGWSESTALALCEAWGFEGGPDNA